MMMWRCLGLGLLMIAASTTARAQSSAQYPIPDVPSNQWPGNAQSTVTRTHPGGEIAPSRRVESRTQSNGVETTTSIIERPDIQGRMRPSVETTTETVRPRPNTERTRSDVFAFDQSGRRLLVESTESEQTTRADGSIDVVRNRSSLDSTGRPTVTSREIERTRSVSPDVTETETSVLRPGPNQGLVETERVYLRERQVGEGLVRRETTRSVRDANGRFQATETREEDIRTDGGTETREETVQRLDATGKLSLDERTVARRTSVNGSESETVETFSADGAARAGTLQLNRRLTRTTTSGADGSSRTDESVDTRTTFAPGEPLRPAQRSVRTIRNVGGRALEMEQQVVEPDVNHQMTPRVQETGTATTSGSNTR
jgi:hypothetical protein